MNAPPTKLSLIEQNVVGEFLRSCTVPLVRELEGQLALMGTGTFFRLENHLWLVTASHVVPDEENLRNLAVPMRTTGQFLTLGNCTLYRPDNLNLDVATILLQGNDFEQLVPVNWRVLDDNNVTAFDSGVSEYVIAGYPRETLAKHRMDWAKSFVRIYTYPYPGGITDADHSIFRLSYARSTSSSQGAPTQTPHLAGVSGASVWALPKLKSSLWTPNDALKVVAVQVSFKHSDYISAEWWSLVREVFRRWKNANT